MASFAAAVGRNTAIQFVGKVLGTILGLITAAALLKYLEPTGFGAYTAAMAYAGFFSVVADLGLYLILIRDLNKPNVNQDEVVGNALGLRWASALLVLGLSALVAIGLPFYSPHVKQAILLASLSFMAVAGTQLFVAVFQTRLAMFSVAAGEILGRIILLGGVLLAIFLDAGLQGIMIAVAGGSAVNFFFVQFIARRYGQFRPRFNWGVWRVMLRDAFPVSISIVLNLMYFKLDTILLSVFNKGEFALGLYGAAYKVLEILITFPIIFVGLLLPALGRSFQAKDHTTFVRVFQRGFEALILLVIPIILGGWILAKDILVALGSADYAPAAGVLQLLLLAVGASYLNALSGHTITVIHRQRQMVWGYVAVAIVGLTLYTSLIPTFSYYGAAVGTIATETLAAVIGYIMVTRAMKFRLQLSLLPKVVGAALGMGVLMKIAYPFNPWFAGILGVSVYLLIIFMTKAISPQLVKEMFGRKSSPAV